jgi:hypothetical protein
MAESKGKRVKQFKELVPQLDQSSEMEVIHVYFKADEGNFYIYPQQHLLDVVSSLDNGIDFRDAQYHPGHGSIKAPVMAAAIACYKSLCTKFFDIVRTEQKKRVIRFTLKYNIAKMPDGSWRGHAPGDDISFAGRPALHLQYEVLWQSGKRLYRQDRPQDRLQDAGSAVPSVYGNREMGMRQRRDGIYIIDWTQEREDFFASMKSSLEQLIHLLVLFVQDLEGDPDMAIANLSGGMTLLPPPKQHTEEA